MYIQRIFFSEEDDCVVCDVDKDNEFFNYDTIDEYVFLVNNSSSYTRGKFIFHVSFIDYNILKKLIDDNLQISALSYFSNQLLRYMYSIRGITDIVLDTLRCSNSCYRILIFFDKWIMSCGLAIHIIRQTINNVLNDNIYTHYGMLNCINNMNNLNKIIINNSDDSSYRKILFQKLLVCYKNHSYDLCYSSGLNIDDDVCIYLTRFGKSFLKMIKNIISQIFNNSYFYQIIIKDYSLEIYCSEYVDWNLIIKYIMNNSSLFFSNIEGE